MLSDELREIRRKSFPIGHAITLDDLEYDLHAVLHRLREAEPVSWIPVWDAWLITGYDLNVKVMRDADTYTVDHPGFSTGQVVGPSMLSLDGPVHQRHRHPFERPFRKREVDARFNQPVRQSIDRLIEGMLPSGKGELRREYAGPIAVEAMIVALGLDQLSVAEVLSLYDAIVDAVTRVTAGEPVSDAGREAYATLEQLLLPTLHSEPDSSLLAMAGSQASGLTQTEILSNAAVLLFGGIETTEGMIANALYHLFDAQNGYYLDKIRSDPSIIPAIVEESLRLEPAASVVDRYTTQAVELNGVSIEAGELVRVSLAGANRDPATFPDPDRFDPTRSNLRSHVTFAQGPHVCLGLHLARMEAQYALEAVITGLKDLQLLDQDAARPIGQIFRKPQALHVAWHH